MKCPTCGKLVVKGAKDKIKCSDKDCKFEADAPEEKKKEKTEE
jgi:uncharacterized C2H2 Zn-finger protein